GDEHFARTCHGSHTGADVYRDTTYLLTHQLAFPGVQPCTNLDPQLFDGFAHGAGAANRAGWTIERRQEAVACCLHLAAIEACTLEANHRMMAITEVMPTPVAQHCRALGRADDIGEHHRREHPVWLGGATHTREELLNGGKNRLGITDPNTVVAPSQLE